MVDQDKRTLEDGRWRDKYVALSEKYERQQKSDADYRNALERALVRISLAADGQDLTLDKHLENLRELLRKEHPSKSSIVDNLHQIENMLLKLEQQKKQLEDVGLISFTKLAEQLSLLEVSRENKNALKRHIKALKSESARFNGYPELLQAYAKIQGSVLTEYMNTAAQSQDSAAHKRGLVSRIFSSKPQGLPEQDAALQLAQKVDPDDCAGVQEAGLQEIRVLMSDLLEHLPLGIEDRQQADQLKNRLAVQISTEELALLLNEATDLVIAVLKKNQIDFEGFLLSIDQQLREINDLLGSGQQSQDDWKRSTKQLDDLVRGRVGSISQDVENATDLGLLKQSVTTHVNSLAESMDDFVEAEGKRELQLNRELETLQHQLKTMEDESRIIKKSLRKETLRAMTDALTGLPNRAALDEKINTEWQRFLRYKRPTVIALLDIDLFKQINDTYGHLVGDRVLQGIASYLKRTVCSTDFVARYGGEEFMLIMPETSTEEAFITLNKIREEVPSILFSAIGAEKPVTVSIGLASFKLGTALNQQIEAADDALYAAKEGGRNQVVVANLAG